MSRILIINPFGIGDVLFTTPVIRAIKEAAEDNFVGYWCNQRVKDLLEEAPGIDKIFALSRGDIKKIFKQSKFAGVQRCLDLFFEIKREKFDIALDYSLDHRYSLISKLAGIKRRLGFNYKKRGRFLTDKEELTGYSDKHIVEYYLDLLKFIAIKPGSCNLGLHIAEKSKRAAEKLLSDYGIREGELLVGMAVGGGASWGKDARLKHWPADNFAKLADKIIGEFRARVLILGDEREKEIADAVAKKMDKKAINLAGRTDLKELAAIIDSLDLLIANDGGPLHMAAALKKRTVSFFGPVDPVVYGPYPAEGRRHIRLRKTLQCSPCYRNFRLSHCLRDKECLRGISVEEAFEAVRNSLTAKEAG